MSPNEAEIISNECMFFVMKARTEKPRLYEWVLTQMDITDDDFLEACEIIAEG